MNKCFIQKLILYLNIKEIEKKLNEKRIKYNRPENMEELTYEQLIDEKTAVQKALLHIENTFGRPVSKEDRAIVRPLYDKYRTLKRLLIRAGVVSDIVYFEFYKFNNNNSLILDYVYLHFINSHY